MERWSARLHLENEREKSPESGKRYVWLPLRRRVRSKSFMPPLLERCPKWADVGGTARGMQVGDSTVRFTPSGMEQNGFVCKPAKSSARREHSCATFSTSVSIWAKPLRVAGRTLRSAGAEHNRGDSNVAPLLKS